MDHLSLCGHWKQHLSLCRTFLWVLLFGGKRTCHWSEEHFVIPCGEWQRAEVALGVCFCAVGLGTWVQRHQQRCSDQRYSSEIFSCLIGDIRKINQAWPTCNFSPSLKGIYAKQIVVYGSTISVISLHRSLLAEWKKISNFYSQHLRRSLHSPFILWCLDMK